MRISEGLGAYKHTAYMALFSTVCMLWPEKGTDLKQNTAILLAIFAIKPQNHKKAANQSAAFLLIKERLKKSVFVLSEIGEVREIRISIQTYSIQHTWPFSVPCVCFDQKNILICLKTCGGEKYYNLECL